MADFPSYAYGTVTVAANGTTVTGTGTNWANARPGDDFTTDGHTVIVVDVVDETHITIDPWPYDAVTDGTYKITQRSPLRFVGAEARADVTRLLSTLEAKGLIWYLPAAYASPSDMKPIPTAAEEQFIFSPSLQKWWEMQDGAWTEVGAPYGMMPSANLSDLTDPDAALTSLGATTVGKDVFRAESMAAALLAIGAIGKTKFTKITSSGTFTRDAKTTMALVICQAGGAGGSSTDGTGSGYFRIANGGSSGEATFKLLTAAQIGTSQAITIGVGGTAGGAGGNTIFGSLASAGGASSAGYMEGVIAPYNGPGGTGGVCDFAVPGKRGASGWYVANAVAAFTGYLHGANSVFGQAGTSIYDSAGTDAVGYGAGGGPGCSVSGAFKAGGNGGPGVIFVIEFLSDE